MALAEMAQGERVSQRNARADELFRLENAGVIEVRHVGAIAPRVQVWTTWRRTSRQPVLHERELLIEAPLDGDWPTEQAMAQVALGLYVHGREIPPRPEPSQERLQMQAYRKANVKNWSKGI